MNNYSAERDKEWNNDLITLTHKYTKEITLMDLLVGSYFPDHLVGYYFKKANRIEKKIAKNSNQHNVITLMYNWKAHPKRSIKHHGYGSKYESCLILRNMAEAEEKLSKSSNRTLFKHFFSWMDLVEYHLRLNIPINDILPLTKAIVLDDTPFELDTCIKASELPTDSNYCHRTISNNNQFQLMI